MKPIKGVQIPTFVTDNDVWFKVVTSDHGRLTPCSGGKRMIYGRPVQRPDGSWEPGAWTTPKAPVLCCTGYHVTNNPRWWTCAGSQNRVYWAECRGARSNSGRTKVAYESIRLLRPLELPEVLEAPDSFFSQKLITLLLDKKILFLYLTARGLARTNNCDSSPQLKAARSILLRCAAHRSLLARDRDSSELLSLSSYGPIGSPTEIPNILRAVPRGTICNYTILRYHLDWADLRRRVDPSLLTKKAPPAHIDMRTFRVVPTPQKT